MFYWRSKKLDHREIYWNPEHDAHFQILAIRNSLQAMREGNHFPLHDVKKSNNENRAEYLWDNLVNLLVEKYLLEMKKSQLEKIFAQMGAGIQPSRIIFYEQIYKRAVMKYCPEVFNSKTGENGVDAISALNSYFGSLPEEQYLQLIGQLNSCKSREKMLRVLLADFYHPAVKHGQKRSNEKKQRQQQQTTYQQISSSYSMAPGD